MAAPRNDSKANEMFDLYMKGFSLSQVAKAFGVSRQSVYKMFAKRGFELRDKPTPLPFIVYRDLKYTRRVNGYYACTTGIREYLHRQMWIDENGAIPEDHDIHHKNEDKTDNRLDNFELISKADHARLYGAGHNHTTPSHRLKTSNDYRRRMK